MAYILRPMYLFNVLPPVVQFWLPLRYSVTFIYYISEMCVYIIVVLVKVTWTKTHRAAQRVPGWWIARVLSTEMSAYNTESMTVDHCGWCFGECHTPSTLNTSFVDFENENAHCCCYKKLNVSSLPSSPYFFSSVKRRWPVWPFSSLISTYNLYILFSLFSSWI